MTAQPADPGAARALAARILATGSTRAADGIVIGQRVQPTEQFTHHGELRRTLGKLGAFNEARHQDCASVKVRNRVIDRQALRGVVLALQETQDGGVALDTGPRASGRKRSRYPRVSVTAVDAEHVGLVNT